MPDKIIEIPGVGNVAFPESMSDADIAKAAKHLHEGGKQKDESTSDAVERFVGGAWKNLNPMNVVNAAMHPIDTVSGIVGGAVDQAQKARQAYQEGRYSEAIGHGAAAAIPVIGPAAAQAGEAIGSGDVAGGLGQAAGLLAPVGAKAAIRAADIPAGVARARAAIANSTAGKVAGAIATDPDTLGIISPRAAATVKAAQRAKAVVDKARTAAAEAAPVAEEAAPNVDTAIADARKNVSINDAMKAARQKYEQSRLSSEAGAVGSDVKNIPAAVQRAQIAQAGTKLKLTAAEMKAAQDLVAKGKTPAEAVDAIATQRKFAARFKTPDSETVRQTIKNRNESGQWSSAESPE